MVCPVTLQVQGISKAYTSQRGLLAIDFSVREGELIAVVGHNGAGKSTLLKMLGSWLVPDGGEVQIEGIDQRNRRAIVRKVGFVPEVPNLFECFSVEYNLSLFARLFRAPSSSVETALREFSLVPYRRSKVRVLSKGLKQRVSIARSLLANPSLVLLDEPTSGLDFDMTTEVHELLKRIHASGKTILFTSHRPEEIKSLATRIMVLHQGALIFDGPPSEYFESDTHRNLYT